MEQHWLTVCALILALSGESISTDKPGACPLVQNFSVCPATCSDDMDCPTNEKCCSHGCGFKCVAPYAAKPGTCPLSVGNQQCAPLCFNDNYCPGDEKCCNHACGSHCIAPNADNVPSPSVKAGKCPRIVGLGVCAELCVDDNACSGDEKCCSNGCGHICQAPVTVKPGRCPLPQTTHKCGKFCIHDGDCEGERKCCRTRCGHSCIGLP